MSSSVNHMVNQISHVVNHLQTTRSKYCHYLLSFPFSQYLCLAIFYSISVLTKINYYSAAKVDSKLFIYDVHSTKKRKKVYSTFVAKPKFSRIYHYCQISIQNAQRIFFEFVTSFLSVLFYIY